MISTRREKASPGSDFCTGNFRLAWSVYPDCWQRMSPPHIARTNSLYLVAQALASEFRGQHPLQHALWLRSEAVDVDADQGGFFEIDHFLRRA